MNSIPQSIQFNSIAPTTMHIDINSCFATIEQQANPLLRGKPVAVAAYVKDYGCILAASREAKVLGVKTGMRVREGKALAQHLVVLPPDPPKYRVVNRQLLSILGSYTAYVSVESIDEMVMKLPGSSCQIEDVAKEIKQRIKKEIGEWITVSIGIAPNRYLAKVASGLQKPDGLVTITKENIMETFSKMNLVDFCGIKEGNAKRLRLAGITTSLALFRASAEELKRAFHSIAGHQWWLRIHGYEDGVMYKEFEKEEAVTQKSFGQSYALGQPYRPTDPRLWQILTQLVMKMGRRLRSDGYAAYGIGVFLMLEGHAHWNTQEKQSFPLHSDSDFYSAMRVLLARAPDRQVKLLAISCYRLVEDQVLQPSLFPGENTKRDLTQALDTIQNRFGDFIIHPARMMHMEHKVLDRIAFGGVQGLPVTPFIEPLTRELNPRG